MTDKHEGDKRQFTHLSRSYYGKHCLSHYDYQDEIMIGMYSPGGGTSGEFAIRWVKVGNKLSPMLCAYDDSWSAMAQFQDVLAELAKVDGQDVPPLRVCEILVNCGVEDATPTEAPGSWEGAQKKVSAHSKPSRQVTQEEVR